MKNAYYLYLMETEGRLFTEGGESVYSFTGESVAAQNHLQDVLDSTPKVPLTLLVDRHHLDVLDEPLPTLLLHERLRYRYYKRKESRGEGGLFKFQQLHDGKDTFLRTCHLQKAGPLYAWVSWALALPNPFKGVVFAHVEAAYTKGKPRGFRLLIYDLPNGETRHIVYKGPRILLTRFGGDENQIQVSLHYLERTFPSLLETLERDDLRSQEDKSRFLSFLLREKPSFLLKPPMQMSSSFKKRCAALFTGGVILMSSWLSIEGVKLRALNTHQIVKGERLNDLKKDLSHQKERTQLKKDFQVFKTIQALARTPHALLEPLSFVLQKRGLTLRQLQWTHEKGEILKITLRLPQKRAKEMLQVLKEFQEALKTLFPDGQVTLKTPPYQSGPTETFHSSYEEGEALAEIFVERS